MRILLPILLILGLIWLLRSRKPSQDNDDAPQSARGAQVQDMVVCQNCGVHLAVSEAIEVRPGQHYCPEHQPAKSV